MSDNWMANEQAALEQQESWNRDYLQSLLDDWFDRQDRLLADLANDEEPFPL